MKLIIAAFIAFSPALYAQQTACSKALDDVKLMCESAQNACQDIHECLVRRDTCIDKDPTSESACQTLNTCMQDNKGDFPGDHTRCDYTWAVPSSGEGFCRVKSHFLFSEEACPGRIGGLLNAFAYGLNSTVDSDFNCQSVVQKRAKKVQSCHDRLAQAKSACGTLPSYAAKFKNVRCVEADKFSTYHDRQFALDKSGSHRVNDASRRSSKPSGAGSSSRPSDSSTGR